MKIIQITCSESDENPNGRLVALTESGQLFSYCPSRAAVHKSKPGKFIGIWSGYWIELPGIETSMPIFKATEIGASENDASHHGYPEHIAKMKAANEPLPDVF